MRDLDERVAVVCGASRGIGKGIALELGTAGAHVVAAGRTLKRSPTTRGSLEETVAETKRSGGAATAYACDLTDESAVSSMFSQLAALHQQVHILVNCAFNAFSFATTIGVPFWDLPLSSWREVVDVGTKTAYLASAAAAPLLIPAGGLIVNISGRGAERYKYNVVYGVGKAATDRMTRDMAEELHPHGVAVVSLWPNVTRTETLEDRPPEAQAEFGDLDRLETPRYIGRAVAALAADPSVMEMTGGRYWVAELGDRYGLTDEHGRPHPVPE